MKAINKTGLKVAVIGSRDFTDKQMLYEVLCKNRHKIKLIVSGGARGADTLATEWATDYGVPYLVFPAMWHDPDTGEFDKGAGFRRNIFIVEHSDVVIAFWDGKSKGTQHNIELAQTRNKKLIIINFTPAPKLTPEQEAARQDAIAEGPLMSEQAFQEQEQTQEPELPSPMDTF